MIDIHKLNAFVAVVEESNISRAAVRLNMQQPPLTRIIKNLEDELDTDLLKRLPRGVEATEAGKALYQEALTILAHAQAIPKRVQNISKAVSIHLEEDGSSSLIDSIINEKNDIVFLRKPAPIGLGLTSLHVLDEPLIVALPNNHPLTEHPDAIQLLDLEPYDFVLYRRLAGQDLLDLVQRLFKKPHV
ncbi:unnamed protein product [Oppiella nova]|uniref:HTH lysR-type domain-containing protein n=1 Tax=Oppiella nova TaxID=334625 RepID=A0A7R9Q929_9ACAR|nr:unnamed protein product [Oppiella nova]CAG2159264.1 unnamed protein product [Oppiella nova]